MPGPSSRDDFTDQAVSPQFGGYQNPVEVSVPEPIYALPWRGRAKENGASGIRLSGSLVLGKDLYTERPDSFVEYELEPEPDYSDTEAGSASGFSYAE